MYFIKTPKALLTCNPTSEIAFIIKLALCLIKMIAKCAVFDDAISGYT